MTHETSLPAAIGRLRRAAESRGLIAFGAFDYHGSIAADLEAVLEALEAPRVAESWRLAIAALGPEDVIVLSCPELLSLSQKDRVRAQLLGVFPGRKVLILDAGFELAIVAPTAEGAAGFSTAFGDPSTGYPQAK